MPTPRPRRPIGAQLGDNVARNMIIAAGARVFATKGIRTTTVEDLFDASKVSRRTFYRMFEDKDDEPGHRADRSVAGAHDHPRARGDHA